jgi:hypothetical protein
MHQYILDTIDWLTRIDNTLLGTTRRWACCALRQTYALDASRWGTTAECEQRLLEVDRAEFVLGMEQVGIKTARKAVATAKEP